MKSSPTDDNATKQKLWDSQWLSHSSTASPQMCVPHTCQHCGELVDMYGTHGFIRVRSQGRTPRHGDLNQLIHRALSSIKVPSTLEPRGLSCSDGHRTDGMSLIPWQ